MKENKVRFEPSSDEFEEDKDFFEENDIFMGTRPKNAHHIVKESTFKRLQTQPLITHQMTMFSPQPNKKNSDLEVGLQKSKTKSYTQLKLSEPKSKVKKNPHVEMK